MPSCYEKNYMRDPKERQHTLQLNKKENKTNRLNRTELKWIWAGHLARTEEVRFMKCIVAQ